MMAEKSKWVTNVFRRDLLFDPEYAEYACFPFHTGRPKATEKTMHELEAMDVVGIYRLPEADDGDN